MTWVNSVDDLFEFIAYVLLGAPNNFPYRDYLPEDEQMNLERAFVELENGVKLIEMKVNNEAHILRLRALLNESLLAYRAFDVESGIKHLQEFEALAFQL